jgi:hypothetical protein
VVLDVGEVRMCSQVWVAETQMGMGFGVQD